MRERRKHERLQVFGGHVAIQQVAGPNDRRLRGQQARVLDWSRGGLLLRVASPRRKLLFFKQDPCLGDEDSLYCSLHLPPHYKKMEILVDVVRVERDPDDPDQLRVGVRFEGLESSLEEQMARLLEPKQRSSYSGRLSKAASRRSAAVRASGKSQRVSGKSQRPSGKSQRTHTSKTSTRSSGRVSAATTRRVAEPGGLRTSSQRVRAQEGRGRTTGTSKRARAQAQTQRIKAHGGTWDETRPSRRASAQSQRLRAESQRGRKASRRNKKRRGA